MGLKIGVYDRKTEEGFVFENYNKGIGDFLIQLNAELFKHGIKLNIGKYGKEYPLYEIIKKLEE